MGGGAEAHAIANMFYVGGVNKVGPDVGGPAGRSYFGSAVFIDPRGNVMGRAGDKADEILYADIDPKACDDTRDLWGFFRFRRPDAYGEILAGAEAMAPPPGAERTP